VRKLKNVSDAVQRLKDRYALRDSLIERHNSARSKVRRLRIRDEIAAVEKTIGSLLQAPLAEEI